MSPENIKSDSSTDDSEINLVAIAKTFWSGRFIVLKTTLICTILGLIIAIFSTNEYVATTIMVPSGNDATSKLGSLAGLGGLAAMAGINLNSAASSDLSPIVYPQIIASLPYQLELMQTPLKFIKINEPVTFFDYYSEIKKPNPIIKYTLGLPGVVLKAFKDNETEKAILGKKNEPIELNRKQQEVRLILTDLISLEVNTKDGIITLSTIMPEAHAAAQLGQRAQELLQKYITEFKIKKAKSNLDFIQQRYDETAQKSETAQQALASFRDRNKNMSLATAKTEEERLSSQYNLIYGIFSELAKQLEQAKIQVKQDTPVFTIIEPISVPTKKSKPNRPVILIIWFIIGVVAGTGIVYGKEFLRLLKIEWNQEGNQI